MLSISAPMKGAGQGNYYLKLAQEDYYAKRSEAPGQWFGQGAACLHLSGNVDAKTLKNLLRGLSPDGTRQFVQLQRGRIHQSAWDLTFSAIKSLSVLWALSSPRFRRIIEECHECAVKDALAFLEREAGWSRVGKGGQAKARVALIFALFQHGSSRANDPQLHTHVLCINIGIREDGTTGTLLSHEIFLRKMEAGEKYRVGLSAQLRQRLGLSIELTSWGIRIAGVPGALCREFSKRRAQVENVLDKRGLKSAVAAKIAALETRPQKISRSRESLFSEWQEQARTLGWSQPEADLLITCPLKVLSALDEKGRFVSTTENPSSGESNDYSLEPSKHRTFTPPLLHVERRDLFEKAPAWNPLSKFSVPVLVIGRARFRRWDKIHWRMKTPIGEFRLQNKILFPRAPKWSPLHHLALGALRFRSKDDIQRQEVWLARERELGNPSL